MKYLKAFFCTNLGVTIAIYLLGSIEIYFLGFSNDEGFNQTFLEIYSNTNIFLKQIINLIVGLFSVFFIAILFFIYTAIYDNFINDFKQQLKDIEKKDS